MPGPMEQSLPQAPPSNARAVEPAGGAYAQRRKSPGRSGRAGLAPEGELGRVPLRVA
jgi:hypothetical protein